MVEFEPMRRDEFSDYWKYSVESWARDMKKAGFLREDVSYEESKEQMKKFTPDGIDTKGHYFMHLVCDGERVGTIWFEIRERDVKESYLWDIIIQEDQRGKGYGKKSIVKLEEFVKRRGAVRVSLNVFGYNTVARNLYRKAGYSEASIIMIKFV